MREDHTIHFARVLFADSKTNVAIIIAEADGTKIYIENVVIIHSKGCPFLSTKFIHWLNQGCLW